MNSSNIHQIKNSTGFASIIAHVDIRKTPTVTNGNLTKVERSRASYDTPLPENYAEYAIEKNQSHFAKSTTKLLAIRPPTVESNTSIEVTPSSNTSAVNSSGISHNPLGLGRQITSFPGLNATNTCDRCLPPDVHIAVGPKTVIETINGAIGFWTKQGSLIFAKDINAFFKIRLDHISADPNVLFDPGSARWFASILDANTSSVRVAVSANSDPTVGSWNVIDFPSDGCPDRPIIGISSDKFVVSFNQASQKCLPNMGRMDFAKVQFIVADKNSIISGMPTIKYKVFEDRDSFSLLPVKSLNLQSALILVSVGSKNNPTVQIMFVDGKAPDNLTPPKSFYPPIKPTQSPPSAIQPNSNIVIDTADARVMDASLYQGKIWLAFNNACNKTGDSTSRSCIRLMQLDSTSKTVLQDFNVGYNASYYMYPALSIDSNGNLIVIFSYSSRSIFPSIAILEQTIGSSINTYNMLLKAGTVANEQGDERIGNTYRYEKCEPQITNLDCVRFGDYFGATRDPSDPATIWLAGEYYEGPTFSTFIGKLSGHSPHN